MPVRSLRTPAASHHSLTMHDIRSLTEDKKPKSAIEMAAVVGYYLAHLAPESDRKTDVTAADITKYFHDANFPLPGQRLHGPWQGPLDPTQRGSRRLYSRTAGRSRP